MAGGPTSTQSRRVTALEEWEEAMTDSIEEIRALWAAATPGPWDDLGGEVWSQPDSGDGGEQLVDVITYSYDAKAIAAAPEHIAVLLAEVDRLGGQREHEAWLHAACLTIAEGHPGWDVPLGCDGAADSAATNAVRGLRALADSRIEKHHIRARMWCEEKARADAAEAAHEACTRAASRLSRDCAAAEARAAKARDAVVGALLATEESAKYGVLRVEGEPMLAIHEAPIRAAVGFIRELVDAEFDAIDQTIEALPPGNRMDAPGHPRCACGRLSVHESGSCEVCYPVDAEGNIRGHDGKIIVQAGEVLPNVFHILFEGLPACEFTRDQPGDWPHGHRWMSVEDYLRGVEPLIAAATHTYYGRFCDECKKAVDKEAITGESP